MRQEALFFSKFFSFFIALACSASLISCSSKDKNSDTAEGSYAIAQELDKEELWDRAIQKYQEVKNKFPYSKYASLAELAIADCHYKDEAYAEAQVSYQSFKDLHPKHAQIDYVTHRLGMSFFMQLPSSIDRDLTLATSAILYFDEVLSQYPNSVSVAEAKEKRLAAYKMLAEKEQYIADFYFKREIYDSALLRYEGLLKKYPGYGFDDHALGRAAISASKTGDLEKARSLLADLGRRFPDSVELSQARKEVK